MKVPPLNATVLALGLACSTGASAETMTAEELAQAKARIEARYETAQQRCDRLAGNAYDVCEARIEGNRDTALAELAARHKPTAQNRYEARITKAEGDYAVARERCDALAGQARDVCEAEAEAQQTRAKAEARRQLQIARAAGADAATGDLGRARAQADREAAEKIRAAHHKVARERCEALAGDAKDACQRDAEETFGTRND